MATLHNCDKCGGMIAHYDQLVNTISIPFRIVVVDTKKTQSGADKYAFDICDACLIELRQWLGMETIDRVKT